MRIGQERQEVDREKRKRGGGGRRGGGGGGRQDSSETFPISRGQAGAAPGFTSAVQR